MPKEMKMEKQSAVQKDLADAAAVIADAIARINAASTGIAAAKCAGKEKR